MKSEDKTGVWGSSLRPNKIKAASFASRVLFLTEGALQLLVVDLYKFYRDSCCWGDAIYIWLDTLLCRVPDCAVLVVASQCDRFGDNRGEVDAALHHLRDAIDEYMKNKRLEWDCAAATVQTNPNNNLNRSSPTAPSLRICGVVEASGCSTDDLSRLRDKICDLAERGQAAGGERLFPSVGQTIPKSWARVWAVMEALLEGADPFVAAQSIGRPVVHAQGLETREFVTWEHALETWKAVVSGLKLTEEIGGSSEDEGKVLEAALKMREIGGTMLVTCGLVHLNPSWINVLLRALLDHDLVDPTKASWWKKQLMGYCREKGVAFDELVAVHRKFVNAGRLTKPYVRFLWRKKVEPNNKDVIDRMISTMATHGAMFRCAPVNDDHGARGVVADGDELMVPARLPVRVGEAGLLQLKTFISHGVQMQIIVEVFSKYVPAGLIAQFLGTFCDMTNIDFHSCWNRGATFAMGGLEYLVCLHDPHDDLPCRIEIDIAGSTPEAVNKPGCDVRDALVKLLKWRYPGLQFDASEAPHYKFGVQAWVDSLDNLKEHLERIGEGQQDLKVELGRILDACRMHGRGQVGKEIDTLVRNLDGLHLNKGYPPPLSAKLERLVRDLGSKIDRISDGGLGDSDRQLWRNVSLDVACLRWPVPRLVCLLPKHEGTLSDDDRSLLSWSGRLKAWCRDGKTAGGGNVSGKRWRNGKAVGGIVNRKLRLFFLCSHDCSLAECGPNGQGYKVKQLREWAAKAMPLAKVALVLASITLKVCTGLFIPTDAIDAAFGDSLGGAISDIVEESGAAAVDGVTAVGRGGLESGTDGQQLEHLSEEPKRPAPLDGLQYESLKEVIKRFEFDGVKTKKKYTSFTSFEKSMEFVDERGEGVHWAWVRTKNVAQFKPPSP